MIYSQTLIIHVSEGVIIRLGLKFLLPLFIISFSLFSVTYFAFPATTNNTNNIIPIEQYSNFFPFNFTSGAITSNSTHYLIFGGTNDSWDGNNAIIAINKIQLTNLKPTDNPSSLYKTVGYMPFSGYNMGLIRDGPLLYLFGGFNSGTWQSSIFKCNLSSYPYTFTKIGDLPVGLENPKVVRVDNLVYIFGGNNPIAGVLQRHVFVFNLTNNAVTDTNIVLPIKSPTVYYFNGKIYLLGGTDETKNINVDTVETFDVVTHELTVVSKLPFKMDISNSILFNDKIVIFYEYNSSYLTDQPIVFDLSSMKTTNYEIPIFTNNSLLQNFNILNDGDTNVWYLGGKAPYSPLVSHNIYHLNLNVMFGEKVLNSADNFNQFNLVNNESSFVLSKEYANFNFGTNYSQLIMPMNSTLLQDSSTLSINLKYYSHQDVNTRQHIEIGFTSGTPITKVDTFNTVPSSNFIGIQLSNSVANNNTNYILISAKIVKDKTNIISKSFFYNSNKTHDISFSFSILNDTSFYYSLTIDGNTYGSIENFDLNNILLNSFSIWNENASYLGLQGYFKGQINSYSLFNSDPVHSNQNIKDLLVVALILNLLIILLLAYVVRSPRYKYISTGEKPNGLPGTLMNVGIYNLYLALKRAFKKIDQFSLVALEEDTNNFDKTFHQNPDFLNDPESLIFDYNTLEDMTGLGIKILINLLDYLDHGTYLTNIQVNLGLSRSSFYYTVNKLKEQGFITINTTALDDQRKKFVVISPKGFALLRLVYTHLDSYFNGQNEK